MTAINHLEYMKKIKMFGAFLLFPFIGMAQHPMAENRLETYNAPNGVEMKQDFEVKVRVPSGEWQPVATYAVKVDRVADACHNVEKASLAYFDFSGEVEVKVKSLAARIDKAQVRPLSYGIRPQQTDSTLTFKLNRPCNISVEVNGDIFHNLHLFANPMETERPKLQKRASYKAGRPIGQLLYFAPGLHQIEGDSLEIPSGTTVYLAGGAVVRGRLLVKNATDVRIMGRGILHPEGRGEGVYIMNSKRVLVEGITTTQCPTGGSDSIVIRNVKVISSYGWGDGLNVFASNNVLYEHVFCRNSDDCTTVYATRKGFNGGCRNITMRRAVLWADVAHPIMIGLHGNPEANEVIEDLTYQDIDILDHSEMQIDYQGCLAINVGDNNLVRHVRFEDIRIEDFRQGQLFNLRIFYNKKYCAAPGRGIEDVLFKNISYTGQGEELSMLIGYNEERKLKNIRFEGLRLNGLPITDTMPGKPKWYKTGDMARIFIGEHVENVRFVE